MTEETLITIRPRHARRIAALLSAAAGLAQGTLDGEAGDALDQLADGLTTGPCFRVAVGQEGGSDAEPHHAARAAAEGE